MSNLIAWLRGKKTYICAGLMAVGTFVQAMGWIDKATWETIMGVFTALGLASLRAGMNQ